jgi:hypothetical protein
MAYAHYFVFLEFDKEEVFLEDEGPEHYIYEVSGKIIALGPSARRIVAGQFNLYYFDICAALNAGESIFDMFDWKSTTIDYYPAIFEPGSLETSAKLKKLFKCDPFFGNILILDRLEILPSFRSRNLGLVVMRRLIERFGAGAILAAIKPFPLQFEHVPPGADKWRTRMRLSRLEKGTRKATTKLRLHYEKLGFLAMKGTPFMFRLLDDPLPTNEELEK